jgi:hypothetical protein
MLHLAFSAGLRVSELVGLRLDQLDLRNPCSIQVRRIQTLGNRGKTSSQKTPLPAWPFTGRIGGDGSCHRVCSGQDHKFFCRAGITLSRCRIIGHDQGEQLSREVHKL